MKFYEKPIYNYKLECANDPKRNMEAFNREYSERTLPDAWKGMLKVFRKVAVASLVLILVLPLCTGKGSIICTPLAFTIVCGMFVSPLVQAWKAAEQLEA